jgi:hypothetical protein
VTRVAPAGRDPFSWHYLHLGREKWVAKLEAVQYYAFPFDVNEQESGLFFKSHRNSMSGEGYLSLSVRVLKEEDHQR